MKPGSLRRLYFTISGLRGEICRRWSEFRPKTAAQCQVSQAVHGPGAVARVGKIVEPELLLLRLSKLKTSPVIQSRGSSLSP